MGKLLYNGIMKRWLYGADIDENINRKSAIFKEGYDDPTYMTFRIEFGDWGASILDRSIIQTGTTVFSPTKNDYDALPIGLLNCPAPGDGDEEYWQNDSNYQTFNNTRFYSAFQYLRSRNEDTRAKYLYYFVNGLFEIQKNYPFIFKKVTGLQELEKFDPASGQRLKTPAKITVECWEGLDLKIRTLMEFYRKAAWDDVYQRWILPENMREFKMIIYVFERRTFQDTSVFPNGNDKEIYKNAFQVYSNLNADIPVKAYECCPCEFAIGESVSWKNDYSGSTDDTNYENSNIVINVKNVKTYYKNGLVSEELSKIYDNNGKFLENSNDVTQKIDSIMIYDLVESIERTSSLNNVVAETEGNSGGGVFSGLTVNGAKAMFLNKDILLENEEANPAIKNYIWGYSLSGGIQNTSDNVLDHMMKTDQQLLYILDNTAYRGGWVFSLTTPPTYDENRSFWQNLGDNIKNVLTGARRLILMSGAANLQSVPNCLIDYGPYLPPYSYDPIIPYNNGLGSNRIGNFELTSRTLSEQGFKELEPERELQEQQFKELTSRELTEQKYKKLEEPRELSPQQFSELTSRETPEQEYSELELERQLPDQRFSELASREVSPQQFNELTGRQVPNQEYGELEEPRELPAQQYKDLNARELVEQQYKNLKEPREIPEQDYRELNPERVPDTELMNLLLVARSLPGFKDMPLEEVRKLPKQDLLDLSNATERSLPSLKADRAVILEEISKVENTNTKLLELDKDNKTAEEKALEMLKQNQALSSFRLQGGEKDEDEKIKKLKNITLFTKEFTENSDKVKSAYVKSVLEMKGQLKNVTREIVNKLPIQDTYIVKKGEKDNNINSVLASKNDIDQINHNMKYLAINDNDVSKLSFQTLIQLHEELGDALQRSQAVEGLTAIAKNSVATNPDQKTREKAKHSVIKDTPKKKIEVIY